MKFEEAHSDRLRRRGYIHAVCVRMECSS
jgi:hypothetical protein